MLPTQPPIQNLLVLHIASFNAEYVNDEDNWGESTDVSRHGNTIGQIMTCVDADIRTIWDPTRECSVDIDDSVSTQVFEDW